MWKNLFKELKRKDHQRYLGGLDIFKYIGPGLLVTVGFIDPGNWASNFAAQIVDGAGVDVILVGDSASNVMAGNVTTLPITIDQMIYHGKSVMRGVKRALVVVDMPFGSYQADPFDGVRNAIRIMKETGADALKLEGALSFLR
jgi:3-methyl-2-oxobutanoate hydroxymethyltransferase